MDLKQPPGGADRTCPLPLIKPHLSLGLNRTHWLMETTANILEMERRSVDIDWAQTEWFQVWLQLARRDYQGRHDEPKASQPDSEATVT